MDYSIRRRAEALGLTGEETADVMTDIADTKQQDDYAESRARAKMLAHSQGYAILVTAGPTYSVLAARTRERCRELLHGRTPLVEFDTDGEVK